MGKAIRAIILAPHAHTQGAVPRIATTLASELLSLGWQVDVWPWGKRTDDEGFLTKTVSRTVDVFAIARRLRDAGGVDVVVVKSGLDWKSIIRDLLLVTTARRHVTTIILQPHGSQSNRLEGSDRTLFKWVVALLLRRVDAVFLLSTEEVEAVTAFAPSAYACHVHNPYDPAWLESEPVDVRENAYRVLFVGRMVREKGLMELVRAAADTDGRGTLDVRFVGEGPAQEEAMDLAAKLGLSEDIEFSGLADAATLREAYSTADVLALPSYSEGFPTVIAEAMGFGLPIVCTSIRGAADHLVHGSNALFVEPRDVDGLRDALISLRDNPDARRRMGAANLERIRDFNPHVVAMHYRECIETTMKRQSCEIIGGSDE